MVEWQIAITCHAMASTKRYKKQTREEVAAVIVV